MYKIFTDTIIVTYSLLVLSPTFKVLPQDVSRTFTLCMLCENSIHEFIRDSE